MGTRFRSFMEKIKNLPRQAEHCHVSDNIVRQPPAPFYGVPVNGLERLSTSRIVIFPLDHTIVIQSQRGRLDVKQ